MTTSPSHRQRRVIGSQRRTLEIGVSSKKSPSPNMMNATQNNHYWLRQNPWIRTLNKTLMHINKGVIITLA